MRINISMPGTKEVARDIGKMGEALDDVRELWKAMLPPIRAAILTNFINQRNYNESWPPLEPGYAVYKIIKGYSREILQKTGTLKMAATETGAAFNITDIQPKSLEYGVSPSLRYARRHNVGYQMPKRQYMILNPESVNEYITKAMADFVRANKELSTGLSKEVRKAK